MFAAVVTGVLLQSRTTGLLRPCRETDGAPVFEAVAESLDTLVPWMAWCSAAYSLADAEQWVRDTIAARAAGTAFEFIITSSDGELYGICGLNAIDAVNRRANLGYWVRKSAQGRGLATEAVRQLVRWAAAETELIRLEVVVAEGNAASLRTARKAGAVLEGTLKSRLLLHGRAHDAVMLSFIRGVNMVPAAGGES